MKSYFVKLISKITNGNNNIKNFFDSYICRLEENMAIMGTAILYFKNLNTCDGNLEKLLKDFAKDSKWLNKRGMVNIKKIPEITCNYLIKKDDFMRLAPLVKENSKNMYGQIDNMNIGYYERLGNTYKEKIKSALDFKLQIVDMGVNCLLYLCIIRMCFIERGLSAITGYYEVKSNNNVECDELLISCTIGLDICDELFGLFEEILEN